VQEIVLRARVIRYRLKRWVTDGRTVIAPLSPAVKGHVGPELRRFVLAQYHQGQVTGPRLRAQLQAIGVSISKRQLVRLLIGGQDAFLAEARDVLRTGLETASWITVDGHRGPAQRSQTASARRSATTASPGSPPRGARAG